MNESRFHRETDAYSALQRVMEEAGKAKTLFERASLPIPPPLARLFDEGHKGSRSPAQPLVPRLDEPKKPEGARDDWIWIAVRDAMTGTLTMAFLREMDTPTRPKDLVLKIAEIRPDLVSGAVYNLGPRWKKSGVIKPSKGGWELTNPDTAPIICGDVVWGDPKVMQKQEVACHRRNIIVYLLELYKGGLQIQQVVELLLGVEQCKAPISKDLVKADLQVMQEAGKAKRVSNTRKWVLSPTM